jgi:pilus assembly protein CpaB
MFKRRGFALIVLSLLFAFGAAWVARGWLQSRLTAGKPAADMQVVTAATEIPFGLKVESRHLRVLTLPQGTPLGDHFSKPEEVVGLVALQKVLPGEILLKQQFASEAEGSTLAAVLKPNMRAIAVRVDDVVGVAGFLLPGNHVDVVESRLVDSRAVTTTVLSDINVLAVDQTASHEKDVPVVVRAVTLEVTPPQAEVLVKARTEGQIQLTLRSPMAADNYVTPAPPAPTPAPKKVVRKVHAALRPVPQDAITIIRGVNVQQTHSSG